MDDDEIFDTPEEAAEAAVAGDTVATDERGDGRWAVVMQNSSDALWFALCHRKGGGWVVEDDGELAAEDVTRSTWVSLDDEVGVEVNWAQAPDDADSGVVQVGDAEYPAHVDLETFWFVRWEVPDPTETDDEDVIFAAA